MGFKTWSDSKIKNINWVDVQLIKLAAFCFALPIGAYLSVWILPYWWVFILLAALAAIKPVHKALRFKNP